MDTVKIKRPLNFRGGDFLGDLIKKVFCETAFLEIILPVVSRVTPVLQDIHAMPFFKELGTKNSCFRF
jgi:hypothetical protein